ncbi:MAG: Gfo/Idh/MocA family oxidoreductase [Phycisphaerales bacterium]|nr:Gfo/Idh/MocA family oxidoreductase [Phycisphaerales bacterium]
MKTHKVGIIMNGVTGRMGTNQHLYRSIAAIIKGGGLKVADDEVIMPDPILVGRNAAKLEKVAAGAGLPTGTLKITTSLDTALADKNYSVYFDAQTTDRRVESTQKAIAAGKHIYVEKPTATNTKDALSLWHAAKKAGVKNGVVQDKLWLPGIMKLKQLIASGFFGEILSVRGEFGYWVFEGDVVQPQRPSWNYRKEEGGGMAVDMLCHWRYLVDNVFGDIKAISCLTSTHIKKRWDENNKPYDCTADDSAYATFELVNGIICHFNSSWCVRVRRDDLLTLQVDGSKGSAVAGLRDCVSQQYNNTPRPVWNPDIDNPIDFYGTWAKVPSQTNYDNAFKIQWELFLRHVVKDEPFCWSLLEAAKGVQLADLGLESSEKRAWLNVPKLD